MADAAKDDKKNAKEDKKADAKAKADAPAGDAGTDNKKEAKEKKARSERKRKGVVETVEVDEDAEKAKNDKKDIVEGKRARKQAEVFKIAASAPEHRELHFPDGKGSKLGDIENVEKALKSAKGKDSAVMKLHSVCFGQKGKDKERKQNIRQFNGLEKKSLEAEKKKTAEKLGKYKLDDLKAIAHLVDAESSGTKDEVITAIVDFLANPAASGNPYRGGGGGAKRSRSTGGSKKKSSGAAKGKKKKREGTPRGPNAFMLFSNEKRDEVKAENKNMKITEISKEIGKMWQALSDGEKKKYSDKAAKLKASRGDDAAPAKKRRRTSSAGKSKAADDDDEEEGGSETEGDDGDDGGKKQQKEEKKAKKKAAGGGSKNKDGEGKKQKKEGKKQSVDSETEAKLRSKISEIINSKTEGLTLRKVKDQLKTAFGEDTVTTHKKLIKKIVDKELESGAMED